MFNSIKKQKGFTLAEVIMVVGVGAVLTVGIGGLIVSSVEMQKKASNLNDLESFRMNLISSISDPVTMKITMLSLLNPDMTCLTGSGPCTANQDKDFALVGPNGVIYDGKNKSLGIRRDGVSCTGFSAGGNDDCPFRYDLTWRAVCNTGTSCLNPAVVVNAKLQYSPKDPAKKGTINLDK